MRRKFKFWIHKIFFGYIKLDFSFTHLSVWFLPCQRHIHDDYMYEIQGVLSYFSCLWLMLFMILWSGGVFNTVKKSECFCMWMDGWHGCIVVEKINKTKFFYGASPWVGIFIFSFVFIHYLLNQSIIDEKCPLVFLFFTLQFHYYIFLFCNNFEGSYSNLLSAMMK